MKLCGNKQCKQVNPQDVSKFGKDSRSPDKLYYLCKQCAVERVKTYYAQYPNKRKERDANYASMNKERKAFTDKQYAKRNRVKIRERNKIWYKQKREKDINFVLGRNLRSRLRSALIGNFKTGSAVKDLGCTIPEFKLYLEAKFIFGMSWDNYGDWELDHIFPLSKTDLAIRDNLLRVCHYSNYQPLWKQENITKSNKIK